MRRRLMVMALLTLSVPALAIEPADFEPGTLKGFLRHQPEAAKGRELLFDARMPGLAVLLTHTGRTRALAGGKADFIGRAGGKRSLRALYDEEVEVVEQERTHWLPVQKEVLRHLLAEIRPGRPFTSYVRYLGASIDVPARVFVMIDYNAAARPLPRTTCFARQLMGVTLGQPLAAALRDLRAKHGDPRTLARGQQSMYVFLVDRASGTHIVVADAGAGYRDRVFSVQVAGSPGMRLSVHRALRLGSPPPEIEAVLGPATSSRPSGEGFTLLTFAGSSCSVELKDGVLASVLIADDPNYFAD